MRERDIPLVEISLAVRFLRQRDWLDSEVLDRLLALRESRSGLNGLLGVIQEEALLCSDRIESLVKRVRNQMRRIHAELPETRVFDGRFGRIALSAGWISPQDLENALLEQSRLRRIGLKFRLGEILFKMDLLSRQQVESVLEQQGQRSKTCPGCQSVAPFTAEICHCGQILQSAPLLCPVV